MKKLLFISVKISDLNGSPKTKDVLIAEKLRNFIIQKSKIDNKEIDVFLSDKEVEKLSEGPYREIVMTKLYEAQNLLFLCSDVKFLNESNHIQSELNGYFTALDAKDKPEGSIIRLTSKQFDSKKKEIVDKLQLPLNTLNNVQSFDASKDLESIITDLKPAFESIYKLISTNKNKVKSNTNNETNPLSLSLGYDNDYSDFKSSFLAVQRIIIDTKLHSIGTHFDLLQTDLDVLESIKKNIDSAIKDFETLATKFDYHDDISSVKQNIWDIFSLQDEPKFDMQKLLSWESMYEKAIKIKDSFVVYVRKGVFTISILKKLYFTAKKNESIKNKQSKPAKYFQVVSNSFWGKGTEAKDIVILDNGSITFELLSGTKSRFGIKEIQLTIAK
jgi:hypothetical protein